jgi:bifunctional UDP-N-acetylglucosamine pyrophosphorylase / glucosamine-1-phosphate N-acetyltransferase
MDQQAINSTGSLAIVILAAGKGTRLKSRRAKVLHQIGGKPLLAHVIAAAAQVVAPGSIYVVVGHQAEAVRSAVAQTGVQFVLQEPQKGTGHAIMCAREQLRGTENIVVLSGDVPLIRPSTIANLCDFHIGHAAAMTILTAEPADPTGYGRIVRNSSSSDAVKAIVEQKALTRQQQRIGEINSGIYAFATGPLLANLDRLTTDNTHGEFYLTDMAQVLSRARPKLRVLALRAPDAKEVLGANTLPELADLDGIIRLRKTRELMDNGVMIYRPETCVIDAEVQVAPDTVLAPSVQLLGNTRIGADCHIDSYSIIRDTQVADRVRIQAGCVIEQSQIGSDVVLGPYSHLRPGADLGEGAHVGNFVEVKKSRLGRGSKANHLAYLGDSVIGAGVNVGAGTITCNYDGSRKHVTVIEDGAFIGSNSTLVAPLRIGKGSYVAAGSTITQDVQEDALALGRARQAVKDGWARERRTQHSKAKGKE